LAISGYASISGLFDRSISVCAAIHFRLGPPALFEDGFRQFISFGVERIPFAVGVDAIAALDAFFHQRALFGVFGGEFSGGFRALVGVVGESRHVHDVAGELSLSHAPKRRAPAMISNAAPKPKKIRFLHSRLAPWNSWCLIPAVAHTMTNASVANGAPHSNRRARWGDEELDTYTLGRLPKLTPEEIKQLQKMAAGGETEVDEKPAAPEPSDRKKRERRSLILTGREQSHMATK